MNSSEIEALVTKVLIVFFSSMAGALHQNLGAESIAALASDVAALAVVGYGIYQHWNMKSVPEHTVVVDPVLTHLNVAAENVKLTNSDGKSIVGKIIPILFIFGFALWASPNAAIAAPKTATKTTISTVNPLSTFLESLQTKAAAINAFTMADAQAAMAMAASDPVGLACYTAIANKIQAGGEGNLIPKSLGLLQLIETARLVKLQVNAVQAGTDPVVQGCAALVLDANTTLLMLTGQGVVGAVGLAVGIP